MSFFYDLNKKLDSIRATPEVTHQQLNERDMSRAAKGYEKYGREGMEALAKAGRDGKALDPIRKKYDKYDHEQVDEKIETFRSNNSGKMVNTVKTGSFANPAERDSYARDVNALRAAGGLKKDSSGQRSGVAPSGRRIEIDNFEEGMMDTVKSVGKRVASGINRLVGHGSDEDMRKDVQRKAGVPQTGKKPDQKTTEAAKYRDPKYKDRLYTQEPPDYTYGPDMDDAYDNPKPDDYAGRKRKIGGGEFPSTDPLERGQGIGRSGIKNNILDRGPRKGLPSRDQISSLKGSIKSARGTHAEPNLPEAGAPMTQSNKGVSESDLGHNVVRYYEKTQDVKKLTNWLEKNAGLPRNSPLYFDDIDLVYGNKTIVPGALINPKLTFNDLLNAVVQASKQGMSEGRRARRLREASEIQQAQVVLASQDMVDQVQKMSEQVSAMQFKDLPALLDQIRNEVGVDQATQYNADASAALSGLLGNLQGAKQQLEAALGVITGQAPQVPGADMGVAPDMGGEMPAELPAPGQEEVADLDAAGADLDAAAQAAGLGRERR